MTRRVDQVADHTPVIVGVAHEVQRPGPPEDVVDAVQLMVRALRSAGQDSGHPGVLSRLDRVAVVQGLWRWPDPGRLLADAVGATGARTALAPACGSTPQVLVADAAARILAGRADVVAVCGGEWVFGRAQRKAAGLASGTTPQPEGRPDEVGDIHPYESPVEVERGFDRPLFIYPLMESALRAARGETLQDNERRCAAIVSRLSQVAATNPAAWAPEAWTPDDVRRVGPGNRMVAYPYTKRMVSNERVDMASAVILTSAGTARGLGIPPDRWVFPHAAARVLDPHFVSEFDRFDTSADMDLACRAALAGAGVGVDDIAVFDLYSCFPVAVQIEADLLGIDPVNEPRPVTVTGGMASFGGPIANYVGHVVVDMVRRLRRHPDDLGLVVANGGYLNRPAAAVYGARPPASPFTDQDRSAEALTRPFRGAVADVTGAVTIEAISANSMPGRPDRVLATARVGERGRALGWSEDPDLVERVQTEELVGATMTLAADGRILDVR